MNEPLVSVVIPCYNVSAYVQKAIESILKQTYTNLEIWIIDDASADDTLQKIQSCNDQRIKVIPFKENTQKIGAVNDVLTKVQGDFICFQDADDWSEPDRIREQVAQFTMQPDLGICFTRYQYIGKTISLPGKISITNDELKSEFLEFGNKRKEGFYPTICGTMMISKAALNKTVGYNPYFKGRVAEDIHWIYRILKEFKGVTVDKSLYNYLIREGSFTEIQAAGKNAKYAYSWQLLSKIIYKDIHENTDVLNAEHIHELKLLELEACEEALVDQIRLNNKIKQIYQNSMSFKIGKIILTPLKMLNTIKRMLSK
jgi:glycosyltransferase involved in cell wall biosynthesis